MPGERQRSIIARTEYVSTVYFGRLSAVFVQIFTFPYYRSYQFNTTLPIQRVANLTLRPGNENKLIRFIRRWRARKIAELKFISIACAVLAAAVIGSFSWATIAQTYWVASALWYCSLSLSILGILMSAQQVTVLDLLGPLPLTSDRHEAVVRIRRYLPLLARETYRPSGESHAVDAPFVGIWVVRWKMVFIWQCPVMFMSYSVCFFLAGLTIYVCTPLINDVTWGPGSLTAVVYLAVAAVSGVTFVFCGFWIYHYVNLEQDIFERDELPSSYGEEEAAFYLSRRSTT